MDFNSFFKKGDRVTVRDNLSEEDSDVFSLSANEWLTLRSGLTVSEVDDTPVEDADGAPIPNFQTLFFEELPYIYPGYLFIKL